MNMSACTLFNEQTSWVLAHDLHWENKMCKRKRSIICGIRMLRQIIDQLATYKSRYFPITKFNNCFIIRSPFFFDQLNMSKQSLPARGTYPPFSHKSVVSITGNYAWTEYYWSKTLQSRLQSSFAHDCHRGRELSRRKKRKYWAWERKTLMLYAGHVVSSRPMKRKQKIRRMI